MLVILGDSLVDAGNTAFVFSQLGLENPYQDTVYAGGGNVKASDGLVLGEQVALEMGGGVDDAHLIQSCLLKHQRMFKFIITLMPSRELISAPCCQRSWALE